MTSLHKISAKSVQKLWENGVLVTSCHAIWGQKKEMVKHFCNARVSYDIRAIFLYRDLIWPDLEGNLCLVITSCLCGTFINSEPLSQGLGSHLSFLVRSRQEVRRKESDFTLGLVLARYLAFWRKFKDYFRIQSLATFDRCLAHLAPPDISRIRQGAEYSPSPSRRWMRQHLKDFVEKYLIHA